jgi:hypothetical protein
MIQEVFYDNYLNKTFAEQGYVKLQFLETYQIKELSEFYDNIHSKQLAEFTSFMDDSFDYKLEIDRQIKEVFEPSSKKLLNRHVPFWGNFFTKHPETPQMPLHADLQYVDENHDISLNIWTPLSKTNFNNATLGVVPRSHLAMKQVRGLNITDSYKKNANEIAQSCVEYLDFEPGEAIIYDHRLLHLSSANNTNKKRVAATLSMVPKNQKVQMFFAENEGDTTFYLYQINNITDVLKTRFKKIPEHLTPIKTITNYQFNPLTVEEVKSLLNRN